jgi:uncharacterized Zn-binding protein involved in type VI secretion
VRGIDAASRKNNRGAHLSHGDWDVPHVGGPILPPGVPMTLIEFLPADTVTSMATCVDPPDMIVTGSMGAMINFLSSPTLHGPSLSLFTPATWLIPCDKLMRGE